MHNRTPTKHTHTHTHTPPPTNYLIQKPQQLPLLNKKKQKTKNKKRKTKNKKTKIPPCLTWWCLSPSFLFLSSGAKTTLFLGPSRVFKKKNYFFLYEKCIVIRPPFHFSRSNIFGKLGKDREIKKNSKTHKEKKKKKTKKNKREKEKGWGLPFFIFDHRRWGN